MSVACCAPPNRSARPLTYAFLITAVVFVAELAGGLWTRSLALLADALHMAVDLAALGLGLFAAWAAARPPDRKRTFGYHRVEVLAALANGVGLWIMVGVLLREAWERFHSPVDVRAPEMLAIAALGLACNAVSALLLYRHSRDNINLRAVLLHVLSDALGSVGAIAAGLVLWTTGWAPADPLATLFICVVISLASFKLVRDSIHILMEGAPSHLDLDSVREALLGLDGVAEVHDLHLWSLSSGTESMSGHLVIRRERECQAVLKAGQDLLQERFGISHVTLQIEEGAAKH